MATTTQTAIELLRSRGMRMTPQRIAIVEEIMGTSGYLLPSNVIDHVQARVPGVSACGKEQEVSQAVLQQLERSVEGEHGFRPDFTHHPISGLCTSCLAGQRSSA